MPLTQPARVLLALLLALPTAAAAAAEPPKVDESALRYYASHNETKRVEAEIRRLRALYPGWTVPDNLALAEPAENPEQPLWDLFAADDLDGLDAAIAARLAADPTFRPSVDLADKIAVKRARRDLLAAAVAGESARVLAIAATPGLGGCADLEVAWSVAAARAGTDAAAAETDYRTLATDCPDAADRRATVLKALDALGVRTARRIAADGPDAESLAIDIARAAVSAAIADPVAERPGDADLAVLGASDTADDLVLLGWWHRRAGAPKAAFDAFEAAERLLPAGDPRIAETVEGRILSLDELGRRDDAVALARAHRGRSDDIRKLFVDLGAARFDGDPRPVREAGEIADYAAATAEIRSPVGSAALGWYALAFGSADVARQWFEASLGFEATEDAARGAVLAALAARDRAGATALKSTWTDRFPAVAAIDLGTAAPSRAAARDPVVTAFERRDWSACAAHAERAARRLSAEASLAQGWCLLKLDRPAEAEAAFAAAARGKGRIRSDAVYGRSLALLAAGRPEDAALAAGATVDSEPRRNEIGAAVLADRAIALFNARRYREAIAVLDQRARFAAETADLSTLRGWALDHLGRRTEARGVFRALDSVLSTRETRSALAGLEG